MSSPPVQGVQTAVTPKTPSFKEAFLFWLKLGFISFGGPTAQIALMHTELVERRRWISESRFLHALNYCMLLPGPEAQQLATYVGWLLHRTWGGVVSGTLFVLPSALILWGLSVVYAMFGEVKWIAGIFDGLKPAVLALVLGAVIRIGRRALRGGVMWGVAITTFVLISGFQIPFPVIVITAGIVGWVGSKLWTAKFTFNTANHSTENSTSVIGDDDAVPDHAKPSFGRALRVGGVCLVLWWGPVLLAAAGLGYEHLLVEQGLFFSKAAMVTFGGAYAVLPYVSQQAVERYGWVTAGQMLDGLGLAETTPGPLIMVLQFVGFLGGWRFHQPFSPLGMATLGAFMTTWTTFLPCFLWIFLGAPYIERLRGNQRLSAALSTISAAVVGVILNLAVWFGFHVLFPKDKAVNWLGLLICGGVVVGIARWKWGTLRVVIGAGGLGLVWSLLRTA